MSAKRFESEASPPAPTEPGAPGDSFVLTPALEAVAERAFTYLEAGLPVHLRGPAGVGKTALARHLAARRGRPVYLVHGNEAYAGWDLVGQQTGYREKTVVDNFVRSVVKRTAQVEQFWAYGQLLRAVQEGATLIYDEFTRSRPEANTVLLSLLEEGVLEVPDARRTGLQQVPVHEAFRLLLTSNPVEYAGVHRDMDALRDRMVTLDLDRCDRDGDVAILCGRTFLSPDQAAVLLTAVEERIEGGPRSHSLRPALMVAQVLCRSAVPVQPGDPAFEAICDDIAGPVRPEK